MIKVYIDVDGVLLTKHNTTAAPYAVDLIDYVVNNYDCYWLTTHCRYGNADRLLDMLAHYFPSNVMEKMRQIKPTKWDTLKTEAIDFNSDFYWIDDYVFNVEIEVLKKKSCLNRLLLVDLEHTNELSRIKAMLSMTASLSRKS